MPAEEAHTPTSMSDSLMALVLEADDFPMTEEAKEIRSQMGTDASALEDRVRNRMKGLRARQKLAAASHKRESLLAHLDNLSQTVIGDPTEIRDRILGSLRVLSSSDPDTAQVYCRRFEEASDEDLQGLHEDLAMLDLIGCDDSESNQS